MRISVLASVAAGLLLISSGMALAAKPAKAPAAQPAAAAAPAAAPQAGQPPVEVANAMLDLRVFMSAMASQEVPAAAKDALASCIYNNPLKQLSEGITRIAADNAGKVDRQKPDDVLAVMVRMCGYDPAKAAAAPAAKGSAPVGR